MKNKKLLTKNSTLAEILKNPHAEKILAKHKIPCLGCSFAVYEMDQLTLGEITGIYKLNLKLILKDLNERINA